jgi:hypothetical protein
VHRVVAARGPDRRLGAWWQGEHAARDYWAIDDDAGRRLWLCRDLATRRWRVHGVLAPDSAMASTLRDGIDNSIKLDSRQEDRDVRL